MMDKSPCSRRKARYHGHKPNIHFATGMCTASVTGTDVSVENTDCRRRGVRSMYGMFRLCEFSVFIFSLPGIITMCQS